MSAGLRAAMVTVVLGSSTLEAAELVSKAKGFAVDFPVPAKETALPAPEDAVAMTEWAGESPRRSFSVFVIDWAPPDQWSDAVLDLLRDDMSQEFGAVVEESYIHREGRPGRGLRLRGAKGLVHVRVFFDPPTRRTYQVIAVDSSGRETQDLPRFVRSFRFLESVSPQLYRSSEDGVSVTFPAPATTTKQTNPEVAITHTVTVANVDGMDYALLVSRGRDRVEKRPDAMLDAVRDSGVARVEGGRIVSERRIRVAGLPARDFEVDAASGHRLACRLIVDPATSRAYFMTIAAHPQRLAPERVAAFFDSFRIVE